MKVVIIQPVYCNSTENIDNYARVEKCYNSCVVPRIGETVYNYMWKDEVEAKVTDVQYDFEGDTCYVYIDKIVTECTMRDIELLCKHHGWKKTP